MVHVAELKVPLNKTAPPVAVIVSVPGPKTPPAAALPLVMAPAVMLSVPRFNPVCRTVPPKTLMVVIVEVMLRLESDAEIVPVELL